MAIQAQALLSFLGLTVTAGLVMLAWPKGERAPFVVSFFSPGRSSDLRVVSCFCAFPSGSEKRLHVFSHEGWPFFQLRSVSLGVCSKIVVLEATVLP